MAPFNPFKSKAPQSSGLVLEEDMGRFQTKT